MNNEYEQTFETEPERCIVLQLIIYCQAKFSAIGCS